MLYEYKIIEKKSQNLDEMLNTLGQQGWELCGIYEHTFIFKRMYTQTYSPQIIDYTNPSLNNPYGPPYTVTCTNTSLATASNNESD